MKKFADCLQESMDKQQKIQAGGFIGGKKENLQKEKTMSFLEGFNLKNQSLMKNK